jgi:hypothetical protein
MNGHRAWSKAVALAAYLAAGLIAVNALPAAAQSQQPPAAASPWDQQPQQAPWPQQTPQGLQGLQQAAPQQGPSPHMQACMDDFGKLHDVAQKRAAAIRVASAKKVGPKEACELFNAFTDAEVKLLKYATDNLTRCSIPADIIKNLKQGHAKSAEIRTKVCEAAASGGRAAGPTLSDVLTAPVPDASNIKTGRGTGTFDTLTGTPLGK